MQVTHPHPDRLIVSLLDETETETLGRILAALVIPGDVIGLVGTLGAGKTRLSRAIAEALGVDPGVIASPTFVLIHEYESLTLPIYHFDPYRLESPAAFDALGAADYWTEGEGLCLIEWADLVADRLPPHAWWITITPGFDPTGRALAITHPDHGRVDQLRDTLLVSGANSPGSA